MYGSVVLRRAELERKVAAKLVMGELSVEGVCASQSLGGGGCRGCCA